MNRAGTLLATLRRGQQAGAVGWQAGGAIIRTSKVVATWATVWVGTSTRMRSHYQRTRISTVQWRICRIYSLCKISRIINPGFYTNISVTVRKCIKYHTESWRIVSLLVTRYSCLVSRYSNSLNFPWIIWFNVIYSQENVLVALALRVRLLVRV